MLRFFLISSHYRSPLNYSDEGLKEAKNSLDRLYNSLEGLQCLDKNFDKSKYSEKFHNAMQDDFNTPSAISILFDLVRQINACKKKNETEKANSLASELVQLSGILGILQNSFEDYFTSEASLTNAEIENFILKRNQARANKDFALSDKIRDELLEKGISLEDKESGTIWKKS